MELPFVWLSSIQNALARTGEKIEAKPPQCDHCADCCIWGIFVAYPSFCFSHLLEVFLTLHFGICLRYLESCRWLGVGVEAAGTSVVALWANTNSGPVLWSVYKFCTMDGSTEKNSACQEGKDANSEGSLHANGSKAVKVRCCSDPQECWQIRRRLKQAWERGVQLKNKHTDWQWGIAQKHEEKAQLGSTEPWFNENLGRASLHEWDWKLWSLCVSGLSSDVKQSHVRLSRYVKLFLLIVLCRAGGNSFPCQMCLHQLKDDLFFCDSVLCFVLGGKTFHLLFAGGHVNTEPRWKCSHPSAPRNALEPWNQWEFKHVPDAYLLSP